MVSINTNLSSIIVQKNLTKSTNALNLAIERMTTGAKLNHASDNAANYSISNDYSSKLSSYQIAQDNISAGLDLLATAQDTISLMQDHGSRIMNLWTQAQNGTYDTTSLEAIQAEVNARVAEINRLYTNAEYNEISFFQNEAEPELPAWAASGVTKGASGFIDESEAAWGAGKTPGMKENGFLDTITTVTPQVTVTDPLALADAISTKTTIGIGNAATLAKLAELVNSGTNCSGKTIVLTEDIDLTGYCTLDANGRGGWTPIGDNHTNNSSSRFAGTFDG